jgi:hypothetical protein
MSNRLMQQIQLNRLKWSLNPEYHHNIAVANLKAMQHGIM